MPGYERIGPPEIDWGLTLCSRKRCAELAAVLLDGWPFCLDCADLDLERWVAWSLNPELVGMLPSLDE